jgi:hypothetical protein
MNPFPALAAESRNLSARGVQFLMQISREPKKTV